MKAVQGQKSVDVSAAKQNFTASRCSGCQSGCPISYDASQPNFPNGTVRCGTCSNRARVGVAGYITLENQTRPTFPGGNGSMGRHVKYGNY